MGLIGNNNRGILTLPEQLKEASIGLYREWQENVKAFSKSVKFNAGSVDLIYDIVRASFEKHPEGMAVSLGDPGTFIILPDISYNSLRDYGTLSLIRPAEKLYCMYDPMKLISGESPARIYAEPYSHPWTTCLYSNCQLDRWRVNNGLSLRYELYRCPQELLEPIECLKKIFIEIKRYHYALIPNAPEPTRDVEEFL